MNQHDLARVLVTMWSIWWARRRASHDNEFQSPQSPLLTMSFITRYLQDLEVVAVRAARATGAPSPRKRTRKWFALEGLAVKMNVDGGLSRHGDMGAAAAICKDKEGCLLGALAVIFDGLMDPASLEAHACNEALALAQDLHV